MQGARSLACGMENDGISEFCLSKKTQGILCRVYDPKISHFFGAGCTAPGYFYQKLIFILMCDVGPTPVHILAHASPGLCSCQASVIASEADNSSVNK